MRVRAGGAAALCTALAACGGAELTETDAILTNNVAAAAPAPAGSDAQKQVTSLAESQRNEVLLSAIRKGGNTCPRIESSSQSQTSNNVPVYLATCDNGAVYAVAISDDGKPTVEPVMPARGG